MMTKETASVHEVELAASDDTVGSLKTPNTAAGDVILVSHGEVRRIPIPTNDPNDPLNFPKWRKVGILLTCCWFSIFSLLIMSGTGTFMNSLFQMYGATQSPDRIVGLGTYPSMVMSVGCLILLPLAFVIGRRPVFLIAVTVVFICSITAGSSNSFNSHLISRIFAGIGTGATESILPLIISDITFLDERNFFFGLYWSTQNCISSGVLISLSYLIATAGWRWFYWLFAILIGVSTLLVVFLSPETKFFRSPMSLNGEVVFTDEFGVTHVLSDEEARRRFGAIEEHVTTITPKKSFLQDLNPWSSLAPNGVQVLLGSYRKIGKSFTSPAVIFALLLSSISLGGGIGVSLIYSTILIEGYGWAPKSVGLFNAGIIPACFAAMFYSGWLGDKLNIWFAKRNGGIHKSEHHLILLIFPCITSLIGLMAIGICAEHPEKYSAWGLILGWAIYQFSFTCIMITATTFAAEVVPENPGAAMVVVVGGKNLVSFGAAQGIVPMIAQYSYLTSFMILLGIFAGVSLLGIPVYFLNHKWRLMMAKYNKSQG